MSNIDYYEQLAGEYSLFFHDLSRNMEEEGAWLDGVLQRAGAIEVLDACCGTGRQTIPLLMRGYRVRGADPCAAMLREARRQCADLGLEPDLYRGAFVDLPAMFGGSADAVIALGNGLCHVASPDEIVDSLAALRRCCRPEALCLVGIKDFDVIRRQRPRLHGPAVRGRKGERSIVIQRWEYDDPFLLCTTYVLRPARARRATQIARTVEYMLDSAELIALAGKAGFTSVRRLEHASEAVYALR